MKERIILSQATLDDVEFIVDKKTCTSLWHFEDSISSDKEAVRKNVVEKINSDWYKQYIIKFDDPKNTYRRTAYSLVCKKSVKVGKLVIVSFLNIEGMDIL